VVFKSGISSGIAACFHHIGTILNILPPTWDSRAAPRAHYEKCLELAQVPMEELCGSIPSDSPTFGGRMESEMWDPQQKWYFNGS